MSKSKLLKTLFSLCLLLPCWAFAQVEYLVNDTFTDTDRIGGLDGSATTTSAPSISTATSTNTQWVVSRVNQMVASSTGQLWTMDTTSSTMAIGYFPTVTIGAAPVTFKLTFTTGTSGGTTNNLRIALADGTPAGFRTTDGVSTGSDPTNVGDTGYALFSATSNVGGGNTTPLVLRTYKRIVTTSDAILSAAGDWGGTMTGSPATNTGPLAVSSGATGYLQPNTSYSLELILSYDGTALSITTKLTGGNVVDMSYTATDSSSPTLTFNEIVLRFGGGSAQFSNIKLSSFTVTKPAVAPVITTQPSSQAVATGGNATFTVAATGASPITYQWRKDNIDLTNGGRIAGATTDTLVLTGVQSTDAGAYTVVVTNPGGSTPSNAATLTVQSPPATPTATAATSGTTAGFTANWNSVSGATGYRLDVATDSAFNSLVTGYANLDVGSVVTQPVTGLTAATTYYYRVRSYNGGGASSSSNTITVTTESAASSTAILHDQFAASGLNAGLATDANGYLVPTSTQAVWYPGGTATLNYVQNTSINISAGNRGLIGYFTPSTSLASLAVGETLTATVSFSYSGGTGVSAVGDFRVGLLNSGGNGTSVNVAGGTNASNPARVNAANFSLTSAPPARGYFGYILDTTASNTAPASDTISFWQRTASTTTGGGSQQWVGPTSGDLAATTTFGQIGASGGGAMGAVTSDGTAYVLTLSVTYVSATEVKLAYTLKSGATTVQSFTVTQSSGALVTSFDTLLLFTTYNASLTVTDVLIAKSALPVAPTITTDPVAQSVAVGANVTLSVVATGTAPLSYQWQKDGVNVSNGGRVAGATTSTLTLTGAQLADAGAYKAIVSNSVGSVSSAAATLTVSAGPQPPSIVLQPESQTGLTGTRVTFSVLATGTGTLTYQWSKDGTAISGATRQSLTLTSLQSGDAGSYTVSVANANGATASAAGVLTLVAPAATLPTQPTIPAGNYNVVSYGAVADGTTNNASSIQSAIAAAVAAGGGTVEIPAAAGIYLSGPITLASNINLQINGGATLKALPYGTYSPASTHFITVPSSAHDVAITGTGTIDGDGTAWWTAYNGDNSINRPRLVQFTRATNVLVSGVTLKNAAQFHLAFSSPNTNITVFGLTITAPASSPNTDGIDPAGANILIQKCAISVGDDNIAVKPGSAACSNLTIADCAFGTGHGVSVGGQTNVGLDGMTVIRCTFNGTTSGIRLKADATQGGPVQNVTYSDLTMTNVQYPIVFYSYYNRVGNPGAISGSNQTTPTKVKSWNATPPDSLAASTLPTWKNITIKNLTATGASGYSTIWGLPLADALIANVTLNNVTISGGPGLEIFNATNVQFSGTSNLGTLTTTNALAITSQPQSVAVNPADGASFSVTTAGASGVNGTAPTYQWKRNGAALVDGLQSNGSTLTGATTATLTISLVQPASAGDYTCTVSNTLDGFNVATSTLMADSLPVSATSSAATLTVAGAGVPVSITTQPEGKTVTEGTPTTTFTVVAAGTAPLTYQWKKDGANLADGGRISGVTTATLSLSNAQLSDRGSYTVVVANYLGSVTSTAAVLAVTGTPPVAPFANDGTGITSSRFNATWSGSVGATGYRLDVSTNSSFSSFVTGYQNLDVGEVYGRIVTSLAANTTYYFRVRAYNATGTSENSRVIAVVTLPELMAPAITSANATTFTLGLASTFAVTATGSPAPTFAVTGLPSWVSLDATTGLLRGTAPSGTADGQFLLVITAKNGTAPDATQIFTLTVKAPSIVTGTPMTITTVAGQALASGSADGTGNGARFNHHSGVAVDAAGNVFIADTGSHTIRRVAAGGVVTTFAGLAGQVGTASGTGAAARFNTPSGIAVDASGNVYVADTLNHTIRRITASGSVGAAPQAGQAGAPGSADGAGAAARFFAPQGLAYDAKNSSLYVADTNNHMIRRINLLTGAVSTIAGLAGQPGSADGTGSAARFNAPSDVAVDQNGNIYVADTENNTIRAITVDGAVRTIAGSPGSSGAVDGNGSAARFNHPSALAVDSAYTLFVLDTDNHAIRKIVAGAVTTVAGQAGTIGSADGSGAAARFNFPVGIAQAASGEFYISDTNNHLLRMGVFPNAPAIQTHPQSQSVTAGASVQFSVAATGQPAPTYQWSLNGTALSGATNSTLSLSNVQAANAGKYKVTVTNSQGSVTSNEATLTVSAPVAPGGVSGGGAGGGGGAPGFWFYLGLALLATARTLTLRRAAKSICSTN